MTANRMEALKEVFHRSLAKNISISNDFLYLDDPPGFAGGGRHRIVSDEINFNFFRNDSIDLNFQIKWLNEPDEESVTPMFKKIPPLEKPTMATTAENLTIVSDLFVFDDINEYIRKFNLSWNLSYYGGTSYNFSNCINSTSSDWDKEEVNNWWALILVVVPCLTLFGNVLVILAVVREKALQTVTNYFIVSLALADLLVAVLVMPFAVYVLVNNGAWSLPGFVCDFYIAMDVMCSTSSIFNLVAISVDRYIAVTRPIKYAKHKNNRRVWLTILLVWAISAAIGSPIVLGLNNTPDRTPDLCMFYNTDFIMYSSLSSFLIPCIIMIFLYYSIFKALRIRVKKQRANRKSNTMDSKSGNVVENIMHARRSRSGHSVARFAETALGAAALVTPGIEEPTNTASGSNEDEDETPLDPAVVISNEKSTEYFLATVVEEAACRFSVVAQAQLNSQSKVRKDSGYDGAASNTLLHEAIEMNSSPSPNPKGTSGPSSSTSSSPPPRCVPTSNSQLKRNGNSTKKQEFKKIKNSGTLFPFQIRRSSSMLTGTSSSKKDRKNASAGSRFTIYKANKASKKKREKSSAKKERKATKTLAIVLGVFLICWVPFFTCNLTDALCTKWNENCQPGVTAFIFTTWLGYMNSFVNPVIYTVFNPEFRKAFRKLIRV